MVPKKPLLRLDLRLVNQVVADAQECPSDEFLFEEVPRSHQVVFRVQQVVVPWAMCPAGGSALGNVSNESNVAMCSDPLHLRVINAVGAAVFPVSD